MTNFTYLALGDSYTIGEQVLPEQNFPHQTVTLLNKKHHDKFIIAPPQIIATTGWTTDELNAGIDAANVSGIFDVVTLLIGVNNQYRGRPVSNFSAEFDALLKRAIAFAGGYPKRVVVLSIPDWGVTPFAEGRDRIKIAAEIDAYNAVCAAMAAKHHTRFIDITEAQRMDGNKTEFLTGDLLHPSGKEYAKWAGQLSLVIDNMLV
ncbi:MAG: SGNH/GDSL hydrolase family protein [Bacteroidetes bacterium]|nr:SGNH/GDSL hydrolase family protein [Bacteroidota bacterium]